MSALLIFNRDVLQLADLLQRCLQQITLIKKKKKNIQISVDYLFHYFYLDDAIFSCFYFQTALVVPEVCITTITLKQKKNYEMQNIYIFLVRYNLMLRILVNVLHK